MQRVRLKKDKLLDKVRANRSEHREIFEEALEGYRKEVVRLLEERLADAKQGKRFDHFIALVEPMDQTKEYDRIITMLEMSADEYVELSQSEFAQYVMDDWGWMDQFINSNASYSAKAAQRMR